MKGFDSEEVWLSGAGMHRFGLVVEVMVIVAMAVRPKPGSRVWNGLGEIERCYVCGPWLLVGFVPSQGRFVFLLWFGIAIIEVTVCDWEAGKK